MEHEISRGAEAVIFKDGANVIKKRVKKGYRIDQIDKQLRAFRTRREAKILSIMPVAAPKLVSSDGKESIVMQFVGGKKVRDILDENPELCIEIGKKLTALHDKGIIHGDLTTANMIYDKEVFFIDFGLSYMSAKTEDKAVDIHLFMQALESKHFRIYKKARTLFFKGYAYAKDSAATIKRLEQVVEKRGRNKAKY